MSKTTSIFNMNLLLIILFLLLQEPAQAQKYEASWASLNKLCTNGFTKTSLAFSFPCSWYLKNL